MYLLPSLQLQQKQQSQQQQQQKGNKSSARPGDVANWAEKKEEGRYARTFWENMAPLTHATPPLLCFPCHEVPLFVLHTESSFPSILHGSRKKKKKKSEDECEMFHKRKEHCISGKGNMYPFFFFVCFFSSLLYPVNAFSRILDVPVERISLAVSPHHTTHTHTPHSKPQRRRRRQPRTAHGRGGNCSKKTKTKEKST
ncbi:hypothetical protein CKAH01_02115 [Colletotrichum kahawae]|uniref:Uncharacterized protein n=1 Tax=Colletotrichum kahawae TaxID=34407 RepID=A0AAD9Y1X9_COLKA|nr:hypothetical protein CKAH01_02115 [Colletotrichum kahawae]